MTQDERLIPARAGRELDRSLADFATAKPYDRYGAAAVETSLRDYLFVILKRKWLILSVVLVISSMAAIQQYRQPSIYDGVAQLKIEEKPPNILRAIVFDHDDDRPLIDAQFIGVVPTSGADVKGIAKAVGGPNAFAKMTVEIAQGRKTVLGNERHRAPGSSRSDRAIIHPGRRTARSIPRVCHGTNDLAGTIARG